MASERFSESTTASEILEGLVELGVEYVFANLGTDHAPLLEEMAQWDKAGRRYPELIVCPHENLAMHMALGYAMASGRAQAVLVHVDVGTANAALGAHNALRTRLPVLLIAGRAPYSSHDEYLGTRDTYVHFIQEPFDQSAIVRPFAKWEHNLPDGALAKQALRRAYLMAMDEPKGVSYMTIGREVLAQRVSVQRNLALEGSIAPVRQPGLMQADVDRIIARLKQAENPLLVTAYSGRNRQTPALLGKLAQRAGIRVVEFNPVYLNLAADHPCHGGHDALPFLADVDLGILCDVDVPWIPRREKLHPDSYWIQIDSDPVKRDLPLWPFLVHQRHAADSHEALSQLLEAWEGAGGDRDERVRARVARFADERDQRLKALDDRAGRGGSKGAIDPDHACARVRAHLDGSVLVINEGVRHAYTVLNQMRLSQGGSMYSTGGGGLGYSSGVALGAKLARPEQMVVQYVGDGGFYFNNPMAALSVSQMYGIPVLVVVLDNGGWSAVKEAARRVYPDGQAVTSDQFHARLNASVNFAQLAHAAGLHGQYVDDPRELDAGIEAAVTAVRAGRTAVLHIKIASL
jgi:acetolactate synthase-1/2/3 large subunit